MWRFYGLLATPGGRYSNPATSGLNGFKESYSVADISTIGECRARAGIVAVNCSYNAVVLDSDMANVNEYYENYWDDPEAYDDPTTPQRKSLLKQHLGSLAKGSVVLDLGCGRGEFCAFFREMGFAAEGIDLSSKAIDYARKQLPGIEFHCGEAASLLQSRTSAYDCIFSSEVIEHLFDPAEFLQCAHRLLKPAGLLVITTPYHGLLKNLMIDLVNYSGHYDPVGQHIRFFDKKGLNRCLTAAGFEPTVWTGYGRPWPFWKSFFVVSRKRA